MSEMGSDNFFVYIPAGVTGPFLKKLSDPISRIP
jgi:hypothetical protein